MRRTIMLVVSTALLAIGGVALAPAASAQPPQQRVGHWNRAAVTDIRNRIAATEDGCDVLFYAGGIGAIKATAAGLAVSTVGLACGTHLRKLSDTIDEAYYKGCGVDYTITLGRSSWDTRQHLTVACP